MAVLQEGVVSTNSNNLLTVKELAEYMRIGISSAYNLVHSRNFPSIRLGTKILVPVTQLQVWIEQQASGK